MISSRKKRKVLGFTLIELLIAVAIISILATIGLASLNRANRTARDSQRRSDIETIRGALEEYYGSNNNNAYPPDLTDLVTSGFLKEVPGDPITSSTYQYNESGGGQEYCLGALLEAAPTPNPDFGTCGSVSGPDSYVREQDD